MEYVLLMNMVMLARLAVYRNAPSPGPSATAWTTGIQVASLGLLEPGFYQILLAAWLIAVNLAGWLMERRGGHGDCTRAATFLALALGSSFLLGSRASFAPWFLATAEWLAAHSSLTSQLSASTWQALNIILAGSLLLTNEANYWIRCGLHRMRLEPRKAADSPETDEEEFNAGRVIGILERNLIYLVVIIGNSYAAVGFILAAKGFARFRQLDERQFAEYMLVGTLASTLVTLLVASIVEAYLPF